MAKKNTAAQKAKNPVNVPATVQLQSGNFVSVMSKLPWDLSFVLPNGQVKVIRGMKQSLVVKTGDMAHQYQQTQLEADAWAYFAKVNAEQPYMKKKIIFAEVKAAAAYAEAKELERDSSTKTGLEQVNPESVPGIKKADNVPQGNGVTI